MTHNTPKAYFLRYETIVLRNVRGAQLVTGKVHPKKVSDDGDEIGVAPSSYFTI